MFWDEGLGQEKFYLWLTVDLLVRSGGAPLGRLGFPLGRGPSHRRDQAQPHVGSVVLRIWVALWANVVVNFFPPRTAGCPRSVRGTTRSTSHNRCRTGRAAGTDSKGRCPLGHACSRRKCSPALSWTSSLWSSRKDHRTVRVKVTIFLLKFTRR